LILTLAVAAFAAVIGFDRERAFYPTVLIVIASYYVLFAAMGGSGRTAIIESLFAGVFLLFAVFGFESNYRSSSCLVLKGAFGLILFGLFIGLPLTFAAGRFLGSQLYGMNPYNPTVTLVAAATLGLSGLAASLIPAIAASLTSPRAALRRE
jgi:hypothetical protein